MLSCGVVAELDLRGRPGSGADEGGGGADGAGRATGSTPGGGTSIVKGQVPGKVEQPECPI